jgi:NAD(P)-dependent dehydrogenase (short-subunit alcohol dehydrogenase family)
VFACVRKATDGEALKSLAPDTIDAVLLDVTDANSITAAAAAVTTAVGESGIAGLVNNAGIVAPGPLEFLPASELRSVLEVNVVGPVATTQAFLPLLRLGRGRIVFVSSLAGRVASPLTGAYCASKFALEALSDVWRMELHTSEIPISVIEPGAVATPIWSKSLAASSAVFDVMPELAQRRYERLTAGVKNWAERSTERGIPMDDVTDTVVHALTAELPKTRYIVGKGSRLYTLLRFLPDRLRDRLILRTLGA